MKYISFCRISKRTKRPIAKHNELCYAKRNGSSHQTREVSFLGSFAEWLDNNQIAT